MNNRDHISESLEKNFCVKIITVKFFDADPDFGWEKFGWKKIGCGINISDPQH
jgi:hypothetical protein